ncbi:MAG: HAD-IC family P-type ATPase [Actinomycetota bacterium]|nr:HAD-IC family P-type ATPase [Actinomycetota bacterium]
MQAQEVSAGERTAKWHSLSSGTALDELETRDDGLSAEEARKRFEQVGPNVLQRSSGDGVLKLLWRQINDPLIYVLLASSALAIALGKIVDGSVVLGVVVVNTLIGFVQEYKAGKDIEALTSLVPDETTVLRDGKRTSVEAPQIVPGDVILLESGDKVPADGRLLTRRNLQVDEAALTGESVPVYKETDPVSEDASLGERSSMVYGGTLVASGTGRAVVTATAGETELGRISEMLGETTEVQTPLTRQISTAGKWISAAILIVAGLLFGVGLLRGYPLVDAVLSAIALAVAAIPEGLPAVITIALAIGVRRMADRRAVIRYLPATETLGSATVICTDKTGTLTKNEMTVKKLWTPGRASFYELSGVGYAPEGELSGPNGEKAANPPDGLRELLLAGTLCNDAGLSRDGEAWRIEGDPTEGALIVAARKLGFDEESVKKEHLRKDAVPFESERQYMATLNETSEGGAGDGQTVYLKGAPEVVLERCDRVAGGAELDQESVLEHVYNMANDGLRVLAFAARRPDSPLTELTQEAVEEGAFELIGLQGMIDPPREEAIEAIQKCHAAGITVKMITGDHAATAAAIGRQLGLVGAEERATTGRELDMLADEELTETASSTNVFARVAPEHKLRLVNSLQAQGEMVAMTGDGVNDAPALKQADIGTAMGITGTDVSKESSDVVLTDDNFASIAAAVEEGRRVYDNLRKSFAFILPTNVGQGLIILLAVMFFPFVGGEPLLPIQPTQILWVNMVVAVALALPLAFEVLEPDAMSRPPKDPSAQLIDRLVLGRTVGVGLLMAAGGIGLFLFEYYRQLGQGTNPELALAEAQTMAVTTIVFFQIFYLLNSRSLRHSVLEVGLWTNRWIYIGIGILLVLQVGFVFLPFMNTLFHSVPLGLMGWLQALLVGLVVLPVISAEKWIRKRRRSGGARANPAG